MHRKENKRRSKACSTHLLLIVGKTRNDLAWVTIMSQNSLMMRWGRAVQDSVPGVSGGAAPPPPRGGQTLALYGRNMTVPKVCNFLAKIDSPGGSGPGGKRRFGGGGALPATARALAGKRAPPCAGRWGRRPLVCRRPARFFHLWVPSGFKKKPVVRLASVLREDPQRFVEKRVGFHQPRPQEATHCLRSIKVPADK